MAPEDSATVRQDLVRLGATYVPVAFSRTSSNPFRDVLGLAALYRAIRRVRPDLVFAYTAKPVIYGSLMARLAGVRRVYSMITGLGYAFDSNAGSGSFVRMMIRRLYALSLRFNTRVIFQNPDDMAEFVAAGCLSSKAARVLVNGSGVDLAHYALAPPPDGEPVFLMIARLLRSKGVLEYVEAARIVRRRVPRARFVLAGWFDEHPSAVTESEVRAWTAEGTVEYVGAVADVRPLLRECTIYVLPSYREGTPRTVLEAMSTGRPVVTTDVPGCRAAVVHGLNGLLVPVRDAEALAAAMLRMTREPQLALTMGREGRLLAERKYDVRDVTRTILAALDL
jgi:glycosyltransferase involved in cell wall biosynthesis